MLQNIRRSTKGPIAWIIVILISIPFALWGIDQYNAPDPGDQVIADFGSHEVTYSDYYNILNQQRRLLQQRYGEAFDRINPETIQRQVLQSAISQGIVQANSNDFQMAVGDDIIQRSIKNNENFYTDDNFDPAKYLQFARQNQQYEQTLRTQLQIEQYHQGLFNSNIVTQSDIQSFYQMANHDRQAAYLIFPWQQTSNQITINDKEIDNAYKQNQKYFEVPQQVKVNYITLSLDDLAATIEVADTQVVSYFEENISEFTPVEERKGRHVLFDKEQRELAESVRLKILAGDDFAELAEKYSKDTVSGEDGGNLGYFSRGIMVGEFEEVAFAMKISEVSQLIETEFGLHILEITDIRGGETPEFETVKEEVINKLKKQKAYQNFFELQEQISTLAFEDNQSLEPISEQFDLPIKQTEWFQANPSITSDTSEVVQNEKFRASAFSEDVLKSGNNSSVIDISEEQIAVLRLQEHKPTYTKPLTEVKEEITQQILKKKSTELLNSTLTKQMDELRNNKLQWAKFIQQHQMGETSKVQPVWINLEDLETLDENAENEEIAEVYQLIYEQPRIRKAINPVADMQLKTLSNGNLVVIINVDSRDIDIDPTKVGSDSETHQLIQRFQENNARTAILEVLQVRYPVPNIDLKELTQNQAQ